VIEAVVREFLDDPRTGSGAFMIGVVSPNNDEVTLRISDGYQTVTLDVKDTEKLERIERLVGRLKELALQ
jgi:hypothetical protein